MSLLGARRSRHSPPTQSRPAQSVHSGDERVAVLPPIDPVERACCCPSEPVARVVMPARDDRPEQEILLCAHHLRTAADRLRTLGAPVYDRGGLPIADPARFFAAAR
jgi:hypothetical protein